MTSCLASKIDYECKDVSVWRSIVSMIITKMDSMLLSNTNNAGEILERGAVLGTEGII